MPINDTHFLLFAQFSIMEYMLRNWAMVGIFLAVITVLGIVSMVLGRYVRLLLNILHDTPPPLSMSPNDFEKKEGSIVRFRSFDGTSLRGMFLAGNKVAEADGMIVFFHEFSSDMYSCARYCKPLLDAGFDIFTFDFRGHGQSSSEVNYQPRQWVSDREVDDSLGAIAFVEDYLESQGRPVELGIFGISRGAGAAIISSMRNPAVKAIMTDGLFSTDITLETLMRKWANIFAKVRFVYENHHPAFWRFLRWLVLIFAHRKFNCKFPSVRKGLQRMIPRPLYMIHGEQDSYITTEQAELLFSEAKEPRILWIVPKAKHNQAAVVAPDEYAERTVQFFKKYLKNSQRPETEDETTCSDG